MKAPVAVVVVNYNRRELLRACLESLFRQTLPPLEIIVVDNGSTDGSAEMARELGARVVRSERNLGFAGGNNRGCREASAPWLALLNNDAVADPRWLAELMRAAAPEAGLVACRVLRAERRDLLDNVGVRLWPDGMSRGAFHYRRDAETVAPEVFIPSGSAMLVKREAFMRAGGFDESFFAYSEDTDLSLKVRLLGYRCALADRAYVYHRGGGGTLGPMSPDKIYLVERNRLAILFRYLGAGSILLSPLYTAMRYGGLALALMRSGRSARRAGSAPVGVGAGLRALGRAYRDYLPRLGSDLRLRAQWKHGRTLLQPCLQRRLDWQSLVRLEPDE